jgi:transposase
MKKTDKEDSLKLAHIIEDFQEDRLPLVPVPSDKEMERRKILASYRRVQQSRNREINRLHALFVNQGVTTVVRKDLATGENRKEAVGILTGLDRGEAEYIMNVLEQHDSRIEELDKKINQEAKEDDTMRRLQEIPGVGPIVSFAFAAHVGAERFENAGQLSNYIGLVPRVYMSGDIARYGSITKRGNSYVRALLVQASWALIRTKSWGKLKDRYEYMTLEKSMSKKKSIVAVARRLAELMYVLMRDGTKYEKRPFTREKEAVRDISGEKLCA